MVWGIESALIGKGEVSCSGRRYDDEKRVWDFWRGNDARGQALDSTYYYT